MKKTVNFLRNQTKFSLVKIGLLDPFRQPFQAIEFETTTYCNRKCAYCPNSKYERVGAENERFMRQETFEKLIDDLAEMNFKGSISPHFYGEPLTDPHLSKKVSYMRQKLNQASIKVVTNGDFLDRKKYKEFVDAGIDFFIISKHGSALPQNVVDLLSSLSAEERNEMVRIQDYYEDYKNNQGMLNTRGGEVDLKKKKKHPVCCLYVTYPVINTFGDVVLCCNDYHSQYKSGNIMERNLLEIWQDPKNIELRKRIYKGRFDLPICKNCWV